MLKMTEGEGVRCCGSDILSQRGERMQRHAKGEPVFNDGFPFAIPSCATKGACGPPLDSPGERRSRPKAAYEHYKFLSALPIRTCAYTVVAAVGDGDIHSPKHFRHTVGTGSLLETGEIIKRGQVALSPLNRAFSFSTSFRTSEKKWSVSRCRNTMRHFAATASRVQKRRWRQRTASTALLRLDFSGEIV